MHWRFVKGSSTSIVNKSTWLNDVDYNENKRNEGSVVDFEIKTVLIKNIKMYSKIDKQWGVSVLFPFMGLGIILVLRDYQAKECYIYRLHI